MPVQRMSLFLVACGALAACTDPDDGACDYPGAAQPVTGTLESEDTCGAWEIAVDQHLIVNVAVTVPDDGSLPECTSAEPATITPWSSPIYSNLAEQGAKWTFDWVGASAGDAEELVVTCTDGSGWSAMVRVAE